MDVRTSFIIAMGILLFTMYYLEKEMERDQIYLLFAGLSAITGIGTAYMVHTRSQFYETAMILTVTFVLIAILYHEDAEAEIKEQVKKKKPEKEKGKPGKKKKGKPGKKKKGKRRKK